MNVSRSLTFLGTPWSVTLSIIAVLATGVFCLIAWRRSGYRTSMGLLELLRLVLVTFVAILLNQPEWIEEFRPEEKPAIAVLWDASASMDTRDAASAAEQGASPAGDSARGDRSPQGKLDVAKASRADERGDPAVCRAQAGPRHRSERPARAAPAEDSKPPRGGAGFRRRLERGSAAGLGRGGAADAGSADLRGAGGQQVAIAGRRAFEPRPAHFWRVGQVGPGAVLDRKLIAARVHDDRHDAVIRRRRR